jgi:hypothetical protein
MSTLKTNTLSNVAGTASTAIENAINGSAKAWVNFNGTGTVAIRASYNVSSITDNGTGDYTVNFTNAMPDVNYSAVSGAGNGTGGAIQAGGVYSIAVPTASAIRMQVINGTGTAVTDATYVAVSIFR